MNNVQAVKMYVQRAYNNFTVQANAKLEANAKIVKEFVSKHFSTFVLFGASTITFSCSPATFLVGVAGGFCAGLMMENNKKDPRIVTPLMAAGSVFGAIYAPLNLIVQRSAALYIFPYAGGIPAGIAAHALYRKYRPYVETPE